VINIKIILDYLHFTYN